MTPIQDELATPAPWERQEGDSVRSHEAFRIYSNLPPSERSLAKTAEICGKRLNQMLAWSAAHDWVFRTAAWDHEQERVANAARLEAIKRISQQKVEIGAMMLAEVRARIPSAAKSLERSPRALALWAEVGTKLIREGLAIGEQLTVPGDPKVPVQDEPDEREILSQLTPAEVLYLRDASLMMTQARSRVANGLPPINATPQP
jgi:hypothetical protein